MARKARPRFDYSRMKVAGFYVFAQNVVGKMTNNIHFQNPVPNLQTIQNAINAFKVSTEESINHDKVKIAKRNADREEVEQLLKSLAGWLMGQSTDREILMTSGMDIAKGRGARVKLGPPELLTFFFYPGSSGCIELRWKQPIEGRAASFVIEQKDNSLGGDGRWETIGHSKKCRFSVKGLIPAKTYSWRVSAIGSLGASWPSLDVSSIIL